MRLVVVNASPRDNGNTAKAMELIAQAAVEKNPSLEVANYHIDAMYLKGCQGCLLCKAPGATICAVEDDGKELLQDMFDADAWILGTPVYMGHMTGQLKLLLDRTYGYLAPGFKLRLPEGKKGVAVLTQGMKDANGYPELIGFFTRMFERRQFSLGECIVFSGTDGRAVGDICFPKPTEAAAKELGRRLVD